VHFHPKEFRVLKALLKAKGRVLTYDMLADQVWAQDYNPSSHTVCVHVNRVKCKLNREGNRIINLVGVGYRLEPD
jgi:DNA-binding response OmpR family regulator